MRTRKLLLCSLLFTCFCLQAVELIKDTQIQFKGIVLAEKPTSAAARAAEELAYHLKKTTGQVLPLLSEKECQVDEAYFYLGNCQQNAQINRALFATNGGVIVISKDGIHISGNDHASRKYSETYNDNSIGTLFATYEFLNKCMAVSWLWPGELGEVIPQHQNLSLPEKRLEVRQKLQSSLWRTRTFQVNHGWTSVANQQRFHKEEQEWLLRHRFFCDGTFQHGHAFTNYFRSYGKEHPEYFSMLPDGTRRKNPYAWSKNDVSHISLCVSSPGLVQRIVANWAGRKPRLRTINLNENDTGGECVCPDCLAADNSTEAPELRLARAKAKFDRQEIQWENELGSVTGRYCNFYLAVQKEADKIDPEHKISGLIYANYSEPPSDKIKLNKRIALRFCPPYMYPWTDEKVDGYKKIWSGWAKSGAALMFRPNFTLDGNYFPVQYQDVFYDLYTFSAKNGMAAVDMDSLTGHSSVQGLVNFVIATLNNDREIPLHELENTFFAAFANASKPIKEYFDYLKQVTMKSGFTSPFTDNSVEGGILYLDLFLVADSLFTPEVLQKCNALLDSADKLAEHDAIVIKRIDFLRKGLKNVELTILAQQEFRKYKAGAPIQNFAAAVTKLDEYRKSIEDSNALNMGNIRHLEDRHWPNRAALKVAQTNSQRLEKWSFLFDPENRGQTEKWFAASFAKPQAAAINIDSHWCKQAVGKQWAEKHGTDYLGTAWYFTEFNSRWSEGQAKPKLLFEAIDGAATIYLNGEQIHHRPYPFQGDHNSWKTPFELQIPVKLLRAEANQLAIRVEKHIGLAGIWRPVHIISDN